MEVKDLLRLAELGYKPNDIKELLALGTVDPKETESDNDLTPGETEEEKEKPEEVDPIEAIIERNKNNKGE